MTEKEHMRRRVMAMDFAVYEVELYLDTHPEDMRAMEARKQYKLRRAELAAEYEKKYGPYAVTANDVVTTNRWTWVDNPWPWDYVPEM